MANKLSDVNVVETNRTPSFLQKNSFSNRKVAAFSHASQRARSAKFQAEQIFVMPNFKTDFHILNRKLLEKIYKIDYYDKMEKFTAPFKGRSLLSWADWSVDEINTLLALSFQVKAESQRGDIHQRFLGKTIALIFEKRSTRTRCSFETAFGEEGGHPVFLSTQDIQLGAKESVADTARVLGRMFSAIEFRGFKQEHVEALAKYSGVPVINGLTDDFHPTQALADIMTLKEKFGELKNLTLCFCGDGRNNVARSLMLICAKMGINFSVYSPKELFPSKDIVDLCAPFAEKSGAKISISDEISVVKNADCLYTDVWVSMGEEALVDERTKLLSPFQVNSDLMAATGKRSTIFMHCLPAIKGQEVTEEVFESDVSVVFDEAENRKHTIKAIMLGLI